MRMMLQVTLAHFCNWVAGWKFIRHIKCVGHGLQSTNVNLSTVDKGIIGFNQAEHYGSGITTLHYRIAT